jgi:hypothetical protein
MKKKILKTRTAGAHAKPAKSTHAVKSARCSCCGHWPCTCPESHGHKK